MSTSATISRACAATLDGSELRTATLYDEEYLVVPVIAMIGNAVIRPLHSTGPEFVPAEELQYSYQSWNGRPVVLDHPNNGQSSANDPSILESNAFGYIFNSVYVDGKLKFEAWLSKSRAEKVGEQASKIYEKCLNNEMVEISVGAFLVLEESKGVSPSGEDYDFIWRDIDSDHLAMLSEGAEGACSNSLGCGAPRSAAKQNENVTLTPAPISKGNLTSNISATATKETPMEKTKDTKAEKKAATTKPGFLNRLLMKLRGAELIDDGTSDQDLRNKLSEALRPLEPAFDWIIEVFAESNSVIYTTYNYNMGYDFHYYRRTFTIAADGTIAVNDDRTEVEPVTKYETVPANITSAAKDTTCQCPKLSIINNLIASGKFAEKDRVTLESMPEDMLKEMNDKMDEMMGQIDEMKKKLDNSQKGDEKMEPEKKAASDVEPSPAPVTPEVSADGKVTLSKEEYADIMLTVNAHRAEQARHRENLIGKLKSAAQVVYTEDDLKKMDTSHLEKLTVLLKVEEPTPDYSLRPRLIPNKGEDANTVDTPPNLSERIKAARKSA